MLRDTHPQLDSVVRSIPTAEGQRKTALLRALAECYVEELTEFVAEVNRDLAPDEDDPKEDVVNYYMNLTENGDHPWDGEFEAMIEAVLEETSGEAV